MVFEDTLVGTDISPTVILHFWVDVFAFPKGMGYVIVP